MKIVLFENKLVSVSSFEEIVLDICHIVILYYYQRSEL